MTSFSDRLKEAMYAQNLKQIDLVHIAAENNVKLVPTMLVHDFLYHNGFPAWDNYAAEKTAKLNEIGKVHK